MATERLVDLYRAAESGNWDVIQRYDNLLDISFSPIKDTVLHVLSRFCDSSSAAKQILERNPKLIEKKNAGKETPLHIAARKGHSNIVREIIDCIKHRQEYSFVLKSINVDGNTALHEAIKNKRSEIIKLLVHEDSTPVNMRNFYGRSPLYLAAEKGDEGVVKLILSQKPVREGQIRTFLKPYLDKRNAMHAAAIGNFPECIKLILRDLPHLARETDKFGWMAIDYAARLNHHEVVREMLLSGYFVDVSKALRIAVLWGYIQVIEMLLTRYPHCWSTFTTTGKNIIHIAVEDEQEEVLNFILGKSWASDLVNGRDKSGNTPLHSYVDTEKLLGCELVNHPAVEINALNDVGFTPLDCLRRATHQDEKRKDFLRSELEKSGAGESRFLPSMKHHSETFDDSTKETFNKMAETYQVVATLIIAITFAAGFTVPGGYESNDDPSKGDGPSKAQPILPNKNLLIAFFSFDYAALLLSLLALLGLLLHPLIKDKISQARNLSICGSTIITSIGSLFLAFVLGASITLPKLEIRLSLFIFLILVYVSAVVMFLLYIFYCISKKRNLLEILFLRLFKYFILSLIFLLYHHSLSLFTLPYFQDK